MVVIRLSRQGYKNRPFYRIVVTDKRNPRDSKSLEVLGTFDPLKKTDAVSFKRERITHWLGKGARPSDTVRKLLKKGGLLGAAPAAPAAAAAKA